MPAEDGVLRHHPFQAVDEMVLSFRTMINCVIDAGYVSAWRAGSYTNEGDDLSQSATRPSKML